MNRNIEPQEKMEKIVSLAKQRGFIYPGSEIYGGLQNAWDFGPLGVQMKLNIKNAWWKRFVQSRGDMVGVDAALIMNPKVWEVSGHVSNFSDPLVECNKCHRRFRVDHIINPDGFDKFKALTRRDLLLQLDRLNKELRDEKEKAENYNPAEFDAVISSLGMKSDQADKLSEAIKSADSFIGELAHKYLNASINCPDCGSRDWVEPRQFNLMLRTYLGAIEGKASEAYFRPETAQGMFVNFKNILDSSRKKLPFGVAQIGKAFRNEITPGNFIFRTREFEQMEIEYFIPRPEDDADWQVEFEDWRKAMHEWIRDLGIKQEEVHELEVPKEDLAHYSKRTIDFEYDFPFGRKELYGLAYRTDFDLKNHGEKSGANLKYRDPETGEEYYPHVIEPTFGVERSLLAAMCSAYTEEEVQTAGGEKDIRVVMRFPKWLAPVKVAVLPLSKKGELSSVAEKIAAELRQSFVTEYDETQSIGKRYRRQDEIGTPYCVTVDFDSLSDNTVTVRDRDTMKQERIAIAELKNYLKEKLAR